MADYSVTSFGSQQYKPVSGKRHPRAGGPKHGEEVKTGQGPPPPPGQGQGPPNPFMVTGLQPQTGIQPYNRNQSFGDNGFTAYA